MQPFADPLKWAEASLLPDFGHRFFIQPENFIFAPSQGMKPRFHLSARMAKLVDVLP